MSKDTDSALQVEQYELLINTHISVEMCKECYAAHIDNGKLYCMAANPTPINCNLLRVHGDT